jgi:hypothetical protein
MKGIIFSNALWPNFLFFSFQLNNGLINRVLIIFISAALKVFLIFIFSIFKSGFLSF